MFNKIKYAYYKFILSVQRKMKGKPKKRTPLTFGTATTKVSYNQAASLKLESKTTEMINTVTAEATEIFLKNNKDSDLILEYLKQQNIPVCKIQDGGKILSLIKENLGFITPQKGLKALFLNAITGNIAKNGSPFATKPMFVFNTETLDVFFLSSHIFRWCSFKKDLPGFDYKSQQKMKRLYSSPSLNNINNLSPKRLLAVREAFARESEAVTFALQLAEQYKVKKIDKK